jgi:putative ABC transport system permease protein
VIKAERDPLQLVAAVKAQIWAVDRERPIAQIATMEEVIAASVAQRRFQLWLFGAFAVCALLLAAIGIYGVMAYTVAQRRHEIGVRIALGALAGDVLKLIVGQGMALAGAGVALGWAAALPLTRWLQTLLFEVSATDTPTFAVIALLLCLVALAACYLPARRATQIDPLVTLRHD